MCGRESFRGLVRSKLCPREGCLGVENVEHVFWECEYERDVWQGLGRMIFGLTGMQNVKF